MFWEKKTKDTQAGTFVCVHYLGVSVVNESWCLNCEIDCKVNDCKTTKIAVCENTDESDVKKTTEKAYWSTTSSSETGVLLITELYIVLYLYLKTVGIYIAKNKMYNLQM